MEPQYIALGISAANFALTWGVAFYMYLANKNKATNARIAEVERNIDARQDELAGRVSRLEGALEKAPTHDDLGKLYAVINETNRQLSQLVGTVAGMNDNVRLILNRIADKGMK